MLVRAVPETSFKGLESARRPTRQGRALAAACVAHMFTYAAVNSTGQERARAYRKAPTKRLVQAVHDSWSGPHCCIT